MEKFRTGLQFDTKSLKKLLNTQNSGVIVRKSQHHIVLFPVHLNNLNNSIKEILNKGLAKYNKNLDGILLGYQNIKLLSDKGVIHNDSCGIHLDLQADFYIFQPEIDVQLEGIVNRKSKDHIGVLVYNSFNVSIPKPLKKVPDEDDDDDDDSDEDVNEEWLGDSIVLGQEVKFRITCIDLSSYLPYIKGEIISILTKNEEENVVTKKKKSKKKKSKKKKQKTSDD